MGIACPLGLGVEHVWRRLVAGESGISAIQSFDTKDLPAKIAGQVPQGTKAEGGLDLAEWIPVKDQKKMDRFTMFALAAAQEALQQAGWAPETDEARERTGVMVGAGIGGLTTAVALRRIGIDVTVYEASGQPRTTGTGLGIASNATAVLDALDRLESSYDRRPRVRVLSDGTSADYQPGVTTEVLLQWEVPLGSVAAGEPLVFGVIDGTPAEARLFSGTSWRDEDVAVQVTLVPQPASHLEFPWLD